MVWKKTPLNNQVKIKSLPIESYCPKLVLRGTKVEIGLVTMYWLGVLEDTRQFIVLVIRKGQRQMA